MGRKILRAAGLWLIVLGIMGSAYGALGSSLDSSLNSSLTSSLNSSPNPAVSQPLIGDKPRLWLADAFSLYRHGGEPLTLSQARAIDREQGFSPPPLDGRRATNFGLTRDEIWLRLEFTTRPELPPRWLLEVGHSSLDRIDLYISQPEGAFAHQRSGDHLPFSARPIPHRNHVFELLLQPEKAYTLYLRVASEGILTVPVTLWQPDALWRHDQSNYALLSAYYGLLAGLLIYNFFLFLSLRDPLYLIYVAFIGLVGVAQGGLSGLALQFLPITNPVMGNLLPLVSGACAGLFGALFVQRFLGALPRSLRLHGFLPLVAVGYGATVFCALFFSYFLAAIALNLLSVVFTCGALALCAVSLYRRVPGARFMVLGWAALLAGIMVLALHNLGVLPSSPWTANALLIGSALEMLLLSLALADRIKDLQRRHVLAQEQTLRLKQQLLDDARDNEQLLEKRVLERTQALAQTNARLLASQEQLRYQAGHDVLTGLVNRQLLADRLNEARARATRQQGEFALLMADLDRFKAINDSLGHGAGDEVLVAVSRRLCAAVRETDTVARVGGDEFVLILESTNGRSDAEQVREKLLETMVEPITLSGGKAVSLGMSIGIALYPQECEDMELLLSLADRDMYRQKAEAADKSPSERRQTPDGQKC